MIASGRMNQRVTVQKRTNTRSASGAVADEWVEHCARWASVRASRGNERLAAGQIVGITPFEVQLRYDAETKQITPKMRIIHAGRVLDIDAVLHVDELKRELLLGCSDHGVAA